MARPEMRRSFSSVLHKDQELEQIFKNLDVEGRGYLSSAQLTEELEKSGLHERLIKSTIQFLDKKKTKKIALTEFLSVKEMLNDNTVRALKRDLVIKDFENFTKILNELYDETEPYKEGKNANYIPQLASVDPEQFAVAVCTVDGQYWVRGDSEVHFTVQSTSKPITYCIATELVGTEKMVKHVGQEPSGLAFNAFALDSKSRPHNPMINLGAILTCSLLKPREEQAHRFDYVTKIWSELTGSRVSFDNATYLSEFEHADRNYSLAYMAKDAGAFDQDVATHADITKQLQFYFMCCSIMINTEQAAIIAATLAFGGVNPLTGKRIFSPQTVRDCLSLMYSCGMYDYSGQFAFQIGLPAKSGVSGIILLVIPDVAGFAIWSPRLDEFGNSVRGVEFCRRLTQKFPIHIFDCVSGVAADKIVPWNLSASDSKESEVYEMIFAAASGDLSKVIAMVNRKVSLNCSDYDGRTPLHLASVEGRVAVVEYLIANGAKMAEDRWGKTPLQEVREKGAHPEIVTLLEKAFGSE